MKEQREKAIAFARSMVGVKWRHRGRKMWAVDCLGLIVLSLRAAGLGVKDKKNYSREPWKDGLQQGLRERCGKPIPEERWQPGDIAVFKAPNLGPSHVAFLADYKYGGFSIIHSHAQHNCIECALDARWRRLLVEVYSPWET